jgi:primosomal protein N' (replication factor Y)
MLVVTQMLAKGHDFPNVTLVGVVSVDLGLGLPDLRSAERTFQLLTQVAGRSGRGNLPGQVLIQTYYPEHYAIRHARSQDYSGFYEEEIRYRERLGYPPFFALASILVHHKDQKHVAKTAQILRMSLDAANPNRSIRITGPAPASLSRLKGEHRVQILVRSANRKELRGILDMAMSAAKELSADMRIVSIEIDPISML